MSKDKMDNAVKLDPQRFQIARSIIFRFCDCRMNRFRRLRYHPMVCDLVKIWTRSHDRRMVL